MIIKIIIEPIFICLSQKRGFALNSLEKYEDAISWLAKTLKIDPEDVNTLNKKRFALEQLDKSIYSLIEYLCGFTIIL